MLNKFLFFLFFTSSSLISFILGWFLEYKDIKIKIFISLLLLIFLIFITGYKFAKKQKLNVIALSIILIIFYFLGFDSFKQNHLNINEWIIQSANNTRNTKVGELYFKSKETLKSYNEIENEKKEKIKSKISFYQSNLNNSLIVRFLNNVFLIKNNNLDDMKVYLGDSKIFPFYALDDDIFLAHKGGDLIKASFSKDIIWMSPTKNLYIHHWGDVYDEKIYVPGKIFVNLPNNISSSYTQSNYSKCKLKNATHNTIEIFDLNTGNHLRTINLMEIIKNLKDIHPYIKDCSNPLHNNDIRIIKKTKHANYFPNGKVGDIILSMAKIHTVMLIDGENFNIKWFTFGLFTHQHSPRVTDKGTMLIFDNGSSLPSNGMSRIVEIDIKKKKLLGFYEATGKDYFDVKRGGRIQLYDKRIFILESDHMRYFELVCNTEVISNQCKQKNILQIEEDPNYFLSNPMSFSEIVVN